jgi:3-keto-disaccharide hydrolase
MTKDRTRGMISTVGLFCLLTGLTTAQMQAQRDLAKIIPPLEESGFTQIFDGKSLEGWDCDPDFWHADGGEIIGETRPDHQPKQNIFCIWRGGKPADFELRLQYKLTGQTGNSGIQYRSVELPEVAKWVMKGYQADIDGMEMFTGQVYEERLRGFLALRGQISYVPDGKKVGWIGTLGSSDELKTLIKSGDWNDLTVIARGNTLIQLINGRVMSILIDDDKANRKTDGEIGIQLHVTKAAMKIETRNIRIKNF